MNLDNYKKEVIKFLDSEVTSCCDVMDLRSNKSMYYDRLKVYRKLNFIRNILSDSMLTDNCVKVEIVSAIADSCDYLLQNKKKLEKNSGDIQLPFGMFSPITVSSSKLAKYDFDSEEFRRRMFSKFGLKFYSLDNILEAADFGYDDYQYRSGIVIDHLGYVKYRKIEHPYLIDKSYIEDCLKVPREVTNTTNKRRSR